MPTRRGSGDISTRETAMPPKKPRVSLTQAQVQAGLGAELLALCQTVTADGRLTDAEVAGLRN